MDFVAQLLTRSILQVWTTFTHNWPFLLASVIIAAGLKLFLKPEKVSAFLFRYRKAGVIGATAAAVATPLCSCGTTAIILGMLASTIPWAPIIAFMVSSPLTSPQELVYSAGLFGWPFALAFFISSIVLGLMGGLVGEILDRRGWLKNQTRFSSAPPKPLITTTRSSQPSNKPAAAPAPAACACASTAAPAYTPRPSVIRSSRPTTAAHVLQMSPGAASEAALPLPAACGCGPAQVQTAAAACSCSQPAHEPSAQSCACEEKPAVPAQAAVTWRVFAREVLATGKSLLVMFLGFAFIGYLLNGLIPAAWVDALFGPGNVYSVPLAATLGLPLYINSEASLPLVRALMEGGMSQGAAMAFLITGSGTSIGAIAGAFTIARWRVIATVVGTLWLGAIAMGYLFDFMRAAGLF